MIRLELKDYCHDCIGFEADVIGPSLLLGEGDKLIAYTDTIIKCKHRERCANVVKYVMDGYKEKENADR